MPNAISIIAAALAAAGMAGCSGESNPDQNVVITNDIPPGADIEAMPPDETVPTNEELNAAANQDLNAG